MRRTLVFLLSFVLLAACYCSKEAEKVDCAPSVWPDYTEVTVPRTIAPLNFEVNGADRVEVSATCGSAAVRTKGRFASFGTKRWKSLLSAGDTVEVVVRAKENGLWKEYGSFNIYVSSDGIDHSVIYRRIDPGYEFYAKMGIWQREIGSFKEKAVFENVKPSPGCVNCHSVAQCNPSSAQLHFRGKNGGTLIKRNGVEKVYNMSNPLTLGTVYPYWHPSGRYVAYSVNDIKQSFHNEPSRVLEVYDLKSDVVAFDTEKEELIVWPLLQDSTKLETFPAFSPDGRTLYFCSADLNEDFMQVRYSLCSVSFNPEDGTIGDDVTTVWHRDDKSVSFPRPSYDGKSIMFTVSDFGNFSIWHEEADLWILDLESGESRPIDEINSEDTESYHSWSSSSSWVVFSSRRGDGRYTRLYLSHRNIDGTFTKPFLLPQKTPDYNKLMLQSYNIPEFCDGPLSIDSRKVYDSVRTTIKAVKK
jgi:Periplasmic component of the Tol biopolymer transport system